MSNSTTHRVEIREFDSGLGKGWQLRLLRRKKDGGEVELASCFFPRADKKCYAAAEERAEQWLAALSISDAALHESELLAHEAALSASNQG